MYGKTNQIGRNVEYIYYICIHNTINSQVLHWTKFYQISCYQTGANTF